jgi:hypothetical protein
LKIKGGLLEVNKIMLVVLLDCSKEKFTELTELAQKYNPYTLDTSDYPDYDEAYWIQSVMEARKEFDNVTGDKTDLMLVRFSGNTDVAKEVGDDSPEMVIPFSFKRNTKLCSLDSLYKENFEEILGTILIS